jgi:hypothetical protein
MKLFIVLPCYGPRFNSAGGDRPRGNSSLVIYGRELTAAEITAVMNEPQ